jgi:hypothetical protein
VTGYSVFLIIFRNFSYTWLKQDIPISDWFNLAYIYMNWNTIKPKFLEEMSSYNPEAIQYPDS